MDIYLIAGDHPITFAATRTDSGSADPKLLDAGP
jgi:hypothetical protein